MRLINDGTEIDIEDCAVELGRTHFEDDHMQVSDEPSPGNVLVSEPDYERMMAAFLREKFMDDHAAEIEVQWSQDGDGTAICIYTDKFTGRRGIEYGESPSKAIANALHVIKWLKARRAEQVAA